MCTKSKGGKKYAIAIIDDFSRFTFIFFIFYFFLF